MQSVATNGVPATYRKVMSKLDSYTPLGYSLCGVVEEVGAGIDDVRGRRPRGLRRQRARAARRAELGAEEPLRAGAGRRRPASTRRSAPSGRSRCRASAQGEPQLGEVALVIGLGLIGQLVVQLLIAAGVRVVGVDPDPDALRARRVGRRARLLRPPTPAWIAERSVPELTGGHGVDQVYLAAGGHANQPVELAARLARDRGPVVDIGKCRLDLPWNAYYEKELDVRFSRSYGPGRYDPATSWRASTTRSATCAGPSAATWRASSISSPAAASTSSR